MLSPSLIWITKSFDKMIKPTKIKNALTVSDADFFSGMWGFEGAFLIL